MTVSKGHYLSNCPAQAGCVYVRACMCMCEEEEGEEQCFM